MADRCPHFLLLNELVSGGNFLRKTLEGWAVDSGFRPSVSSYYLSHGVMGYLREACSPMGFLVGWRLNELGTVPVFSTGAMPMQEPVAAPSVATFSTLREEELQPVPNAEKPAALKNKAVYRGSGEADGLADETDKEKPKSEQRCPAVNFNSEEFKTANPEVQQWFREQYVTKECPESQCRYYVDNFGYTKDRWDETLGGQPGGGFRKQMTRRDELEAGTILWRYTGLDCPMGCWWFLAPMSDDPRAFAALPQGASGQYLVKGRTKRKTPILRGPGAPRCTNKPGGPEQIYVPFDRNATKAESQWIEICDVNAPAGGA